MATIKEHYNNVKNDELRKRLLESLDSNNSEIVVVSLFEAIYGGFYWTEVHAKYWTNITENISAIELINNDI
jgi:ribosomal protein S24E